MQITIYYAALLALLYVCLCLRVIFIRKRIKLAIGSGGHKLLERAIRAQGNFNEYAPITIILLYFLEVQKVSEILLNALCATFLISRFAHAYGVSRVNENLKFRVFGMYGTVSIVIFCAIYLLVIGIGLI